MCTVFSWLHGCQKCRVHLASRVCCLVMQHRQQYQQVDVVLTAKGRIAAATYRTRSIISTARPIFVYFTMGRAMERSPRLALLSVDPVLQLIHDYLVPVGGVAQWYNVGL